MTDLHDSLKSEFGDKIKDISDKQDGMVKKVEVDSLFNELKHMISDGKSNSNHAEEFIDHMTTCNDKGCSINMMGDDMKKKGFLTGYALAKKQFEKKQ